MVRQNL
ncbi:hypothetical protein LINPERHAP1_LOCUS31384 [Linum perenne]